MDPLKLKIINLKNRSGYWFEIPFSGSLVILIDPKAIPNRLVIHGRNYMGEEKRVGRAR